MHDPIAQPAWLDLLDRHAAALILFARQWCPSHADAEDAVQEAFIHCWRSQVKIDDSVAYLFTCVKHAALDQQRGTKRRWRREATVGSQSQPTNESCFVSAIEEQERTAIIEHHLGQLPQDQREVVVMKLWGGLTFSQIARVLEASPDTIASRYRYALQTMRRLLPQEQVT